MKLVVVLALALFILSGKAIELTEKTFTEIVSDQASAKVVVFYDDGESSQSALANAEAASDVILQKFPDIQFFKVNGKAPENEKEINQAHFTEFPYVFFATREDGIERLQDSSEDGILKTVSDKLEPVDYDVVKSIETEADWEEVSAKPRFVKYFEQWCPHCRSIKKSWAKAAQLSASEDYIFVEIECSKSESNKKICQEFGKVAGFPTLRFYPVGGEPQSVKYEGPRTVNGFMSFAKKYMSEPLPDEDSQAQAVEQKEEEQTEKKSADSSDDLKLLRSDISKLTKEIENLTRSIEEVRRTIKLNNAKGQKIDRHEEL